MLCYSLVKCSGEGWPAPRVMPQLMILSLVAWSSLVVVKLSTLANGNRSLTTHWLRVLNALEDLQSATTVPFEQLLGHLHLLRSLVRHLWLQGGLILGSSRWHSIACHIYIEASAWRAHAESRDVLASFLHRVGHEFFFTSTFLTE